MRHYQLSRSCPLSGPRDVHRVRSREVCKRRRKTSLARGKRCRVAFGPAVHAFRAARRAADAAARQAAADARAAEAARLHANLSRVDGVACRLGGALGLATGTEAPAPPDLLALYRQSAHGAHSHSAFSPLFGEAAAGAVGAGAVGTVGAVGAVGAVAAARRRRLPRVPPAAEAAPALAPLEPKVAIAQLAAQEAAAAAARAAVDADPRNRYALGGAPTDGILASMLGTMAYHGKPIARRAALARLARPT